MSTRNEDTTPRYVRSARGPKATKVLIVDDEERFRENLAQRLTFRGFMVAAVDNGQEAVKRVRLDTPDVVLLDRKMPGMTGEDTLKEIKRIAPVVQVVMLTGHGDISSAAAAGRLDAFAYLEKPCETDVLIETIESARTEKHRAMNRREMPTADNRTLRTWLKGSHNSRPGVIILAAVLFAALVIAPSPESLIRVLDTPKVGDGTELVAGYSKYSSMAVGETVSHYYGKSVRQPLSPQEAAFNAKVMVGILVVAALFWATGALPIGITALLVGVLMYLFGVFPPDMVAQAYAKDAVLFIMGVLALSSAIAKTGLDRRIGLVLLGTSRSLTAFLFLFCPLLAISAAFLSEHALVAFIAPLLIMVYMAGIRAAGLSRDRHLAVLLILSLCFVANQGGPGSPAAGGRNAIMIGILSDYGIAPSFWEWVTYGLPFVPVAALAIAAYFNFTVRRKVKVSTLNVGAIVRRESKKLGKMTREEYVTLAVLLGIIVLWCTASDVIGMGGPVLLGLVVLSISRVVVWRDINKIPWDVVALYGSACAMGVGLAQTGAALWIARGFVSILPESLAHGEGLAVASSLFTGVLTNLMSDGATVSAIGPITVPMASISGTHPWMVGFATAFASSFANCFIVGTPNNAIAYALAKDMETGEQLVTLGDFLKHGFAVTLIAFAVLWGWAFFGYWQWIGFQ